MNVINYFLWLTVMRQKGKLRYCVYTQISSYCDWRNLYNSLLNIRENRRSEQARSLLRLKKPRQLCAVSCTCVHVNVGHYLWQNVHPPLLHLHECPCGSECVVCYLNTGLGFHIKGPFTVKWQRQPLCLPPVLISHSHCLSPISIFF